MVGWFIKESTHFYSKDADFDVDGNEVVDGYSETDCNNGSCLNFGVKVAGNCHTV